MNGIIMYKDSPHNFFLNGNTEKKKKKVYNKVWLVTNTVPSIHLTLYYFKLFYFTTKQSFVLTDLNVPISISEK